MRPSASITRHFNEENGEVKAAVSDGLLTSLVTVSVTFAYFQVVNFLGTRYPMGTQEALGFVAVRDYLRWENLGLAASLGAMAAAFSFIAIVLASSERRPRSIKRSVMMTTAALIVAVGIATTAGVLMAQQLTLSSFLESVTALGFVAVPATLRLTSPKAFSYRCPDPAAIIVGWTSDIEEAP